MTGQEVKEAALRARAAQSRFRRKDLALRPAFYGHLAALLRGRAAEVLAANALDAEAARAAGLSAAMVDRLLLTPARLEALARAVEEIAAQPDPLAAIEGRRLAGGAVLEKVRVPIGLVGFIFESRPGVVVEAAALCLKAGNAVLLKGGKEAARSNVALESLVRAALLKAGLPADLVALLESTDRSVVTSLVRLEGIVDLVIPRGGKGLIKAVMDESRVPVIKHYEGNCHVYVHASADLAMAVDLVDNAKTQRPGTCNAAESLLVDQAVLAEFLPLLAARLGPKGVELRACPACRRVLPGLKEAGEEDWGAEYLDLVLSVKAVADLDEAVAHIERYGSGHTEAVVARDLAAARRFLDEVDSSAVMVNASTRLNDGGQFGLGAEVGISTDRLHARGPMGAADLTTYKYLLLGDGHVRS